MKQRSKNRYVRDLVRVHEVIIIHIQNSQIISALQLEIVALYWVLKQGFIKVKVKGKVRRPQCSACCSVYNSVSRQHNTIIPTNAQISPPFHQSTKHSIWL